MRVRGSYYGRGKVVAYRHSEGAIALVRARAVGNGERGGGKVVHHQARGGVGGQAVAGQTEGLDDVATGSAVVRHSHTERS